MNANSLKETADADRPADVARLAADGFPWRRLCRGNVTLAFAGWAFNTTPDSVLDRLCARPEGPAPDTLCAIARHIDGHFAFAACGPDWTVAAVDRVRSIPLFFAQVCGTWTLDCRANRLRRQAGLEEKDIDRDAALAIAMAGYTIGNATLYRGLHMLMPGECALFRGDAVPARHRYHTFTPWLVADGDPDRYQRELRDVTLAIVEKHLKSLDGRPLVVPLSAGYDSRLIASAAKHLGYRNIRTFAYGRRDNFEAETSRAIAERLGLPWTFVPLTIRGQRDYFVGSDHAEYMEFADSAASSPFVQDLTAIRALRASGFIADDAVIANGNSGDFISGNHIVPPLRQVPDGMTRDERRERVLVALIDKHFALWRHLRTPGNHARIRALLEASLVSAAAAMGDPAADHGLYEYSEFQDRQCKYVITGQRIYEFLGHGWRLPLWDNDYLDFWARVSLSLKSSQLLYQRMLHSENWGGVWTQIPVNRKTIRPRWLVPLRLAAKAAFVPFGAERWHRFERQAFTYWMDATCNYACVPYWRAATDQRGQRLSVSWLSEQYLARHGVNIDEFAGQA